MLDMSIKSVAFLSTLLVSISNSLPPAAVYAAEEKTDGKVLVLMVYDDQCQKFCGQVRPILQELKAEYADRVFVQEVNTTQNVLSKSQKLTEELGVGSFLPGVIDSVPCVGVFTRRKRLVKELTGVKKKEVYVRFIEKALGAS
ncbi:MAG: hypothetical protein K2Z81_07045 [Cyanobacteria bacterium]|nr:hypothetical protein [Cyanobacteriota bacterium]